MSADIWKFLQQYNAPANPYQQLQTQPDLARLAFEAARSWAIANAAMASPEAFGKQVAQVYRAVLSPAAKPTPEQASSEKQQQPPLPSGRALLSRKSSTQKRKVGSK